MGMTVKARSKLVSVSTHVMGDYMVFVALTGDGALWYAEIPTVEMNGNQWELDWVRKEGPMVSL